MNKYQEALNNLIKVSCPKGRCCKECDFEKICNCEAKSYIDTLQELVDKVIPKKPDLFYKTTSMLVKCPNCGTWMNEGQDVNYCDNCGQAIDWSDEDE